MRSTAPEPPPRAGHSSTAAVQKKKKKTRRRSMIRFWFVLILLGVSLFALLSLLVPWVFFQRQPGYHPYPPSSSQQQNGPLHPLFLPNRAGIRAFSNATDTGAFRLEQPTKQQDKEEDVVTPRAIKWEHLLQDDDFAQRPVARGVAGRPLEQTPGVAFAVRHSLQNCRTGGNASQPLPVDSVVYWNDYPDAAAASQSPFAAAAASTDSPGYIAFSPDRGGWNNVRMSMEIILVVAAATGRTVVLPPKEPLYLLHHDEQQRYKGFADFYPLDLPEFQQRVPVISFAEFVQAEGGPEGRFPIPDDLRENVLPLADHCEGHRASRANNCLPVYEYLRTVGHLVNISSVESCVVFDEDVYRDNNAHNASEQVLPPDRRDYVAQVCGERSRYFWKEGLHEHGLWFLDAGNNQNRLLTHFYNMIHFTNPKWDHYYKRFVRDFLHYHDRIWCAAGIVVKAVQAEGRARGFRADANGAGGYSALHVRRGDLQYKRVKISAQEWYDNTHEVWMPNEILYIATDERNKTFFDDLARHHSLRFLDDYWELAGLGDLDGNFLGMVDTIVASRGRTFTGTWFSTFSGYINRMRGYHGMSMNDSWYSFLPKKTAVHQWPLIDDSRYAFEWPDGWIGIDADEWPSRDAF